MSQATAPNQDLKKRIKELEEENCQLALRLTKAGRHVNRLRLERRLLLERLEHFELQQQPSSHESAVLNGDTTNNGLSVKE